MESKLKAQCMDSVGENATESTDANRELVNSMQNLMMIPIKLPANVRVSNIEFIPDAPDLPAGFPHLPTTPIKKEPRLTDWISGDLKPVRDGVYQRKYDDGAELEKIHFCKFENGLWFSWGKNIENADAEYVNSVFQNLPWRGFFSNPNEVQS